MSDEFIKYSLATLTKYIILQSTSFAKKRRHYSESKPKRTNLETSAISLFGKTIIQIKNLGFKLGFLLKSFPENQQKVKPEDQQKIKEEINKLIESFKNIQDEINIISLGSLDEELGSLIYSFTAIICRTSTLLEAIPLCDQLLQTIQLPVKDQNHQEHHATLEAIADTILTMVNTKQDDYLQPLPMLVAHLYNYLDNLKSQGANSLINQLKPLYLPLFKLANTVTQRWDAAFFCEPINIQTIDNTVTNIPSIPKRDCRNSKSQTPPKHCIANVAVNGKNIIQDLLEHSKKEVLGNYLAATRELKEEVLHNLNQKNPQLKDLNEKNPEMYQILLNDAIGSLTDLNLLRAYGAHERDSGGTRSNKSIVATAAIDKLIGDYIDAETLNLKNTDQKPPFTFVVISRLVILYLALQLLIGLQEALKNVLKLAKINKSITSQKHNKSPRQDSSVKKQIKLTKSSSKTTLNPSSSHTRPSSQDLRKVDKKHPLILTLLQPSVIENKHTSKDKNRRFITHHDHIQFLGLESSNLAMLQDFFKSITSTITKCFNLFKQFNKTLEAQETITALQDMLKTSKKTTRSVSFCGDLSPTNSFSDLPSPPQIPVPQSQTSEYINLFKQNFSEYCEVLGKKTLQAKQHNAEISNKLDSAYSPAQG